MNVNRKSFEVHKIENLGCGGAQVREVTLDSLELLLIGLKS